MAASDPLEAREEEGEKDKQESEDPCDAGGDGVMHGGRGEGGKSVGFQTIWKRSARWRDLGMRRAHRA